MNQSYCVITYITANSSLYAAKFTAVTPTAVPLGFYCSEGSPDNCAPVIHSAQRNYKFCIQYEMWKSLQFTGAKINLCIIFKKLHSLIFKFSAALLTFNPLNPELNSICYLLELLAHHFLHVSRIRVKSLTLRLLMSHICIYIYIYIYIWSTYS